MSSKRTKINPAHLSTNIIESVFHPLTKLILQFHYYFGLTKDEVIYLNASQTKVYDHYLNIPKKISCNGKTRSIPIFSEKQQHLLQHYYALLDGKNALVDLIDLNTINQIYYGDIKWQGYNAYTPFRKNFILYRFSYLQKHDKKTKNQCLIQISQELGFKNIGEITQWVEVNE